MQSAFQSRQKTQKTKETLQTERSGEEKNKTMTMKRGHRNWQERVKSSIKARWVLDFQGVFETLHCHVSESGVWSLLYHPCVRIVLCTSQAYVRFAALNGIYQVLLMHDDMCTFPHTAAHLYAVEEKSNKADKLKRRSVHPSYCQAYVID